VQKEFDELLQGGCDEGRKREEAEEPLMVTVGLGLKPPRSVASLGRGLA